jgi:hypothetical protein
MAETFQEWRQGAIEGLFLIAADSNQQQPQAQEMARRLAAFIAGAKFTIHIAIYDFRLVSATATPVLDALKERGQAGVTIRIAYHQDRQMAHFAAAEFARIGGDPAPPGTGDFLAALDGTGIEIKPIDGQGHLMHNKLCHSRRNDARRHGMDGVGQFYRWRLVVAGKQRADPQLPGSRTVL